MTLEEDAGMGDEIKRWKNRESALKHRIIPPGAPEVERLRQAQVYHTLIDCLPERGLSVTTLTLKALRRAVAARWRPPGDRKRSKPTLTQLRSVLDGLKSAGLISWTAGKGIGTPRAYRFPEEYDGAPDGILIPDESPPPQDHHIDPRVTAAMKASVEKARAAIDAKRDALSAPYTTPPAPLQEAKPAPPAPKPAPPEDREPPEPEIIKTHEHGLKSMGNEMLATQEHWREVIFDNASMVMPWLQAYSKRAWGWRDIMSCELEYSEVMPPSHQLKPGYRPPPDSPCEALDRLAGIDALAWDGNRRPFAIQIKARSGDKFEVSRFEISEASHAWMMGLLAPYAYVFVWVSNGMPIGAWRVSLRKLRDLIGKAEGATMSLSVWQLQRLEVEAGNLSLVEEDAA
jgi:hypothetical protein